MMKIRRSSILATICVVVGGVAIWLAFRPENLLCLHDRIIPACNPNFYYLVPGIIVVIGGLAILIFRYKRSMTG